MMKLSLPFLASYEEQGGEEEQTFSKTYALVYALAVKSKCNDFKNSKYICLLYVKYA